MYTVPSYQDASSANAFLAFLASASSSLFHPSVAYFHPSAAYFHPSTSDQFSSHLIQGKFWNKKIAIIKKMYLMLTAGDV